MTDTIAETTDAAEAELSLSASHDLDETLLSGDGHLASPALTLGVPERGAEIGRYVVLSTLGAGAMGVVLAAYDPQLDRKVAIKLLKQRARRNEEAARARLQREAQALAKLSHTNVVGVHDVGVHQGQVFVAMEFVQGETLGAWMHAQPRAYTEVVPVFESAGRGLAAAHAQGLIHRDFKPDNVMIGDTGRVRVMDFGLARSEDLDVNESVDLEDPALEQLSVHETALTMTGALLGTPAYMSPEQFMGTEVTARSDQFGFCIALFEALYGARPFTGTTLAEVAFQVGEGEIVEPPRRSGVPAVPGWLRAVVRRGLSSDPHSRFADMDALVFALGAGDARRRRRRLLWFAAGLGAVALGVWGLQRWQLSRTHAECVAQGEAAVGNWDASVLSRVQENLAAGELDYAQQSAGRVVHYLDAHAEGLRSTQRDMCVAARVRRTIDEASLERATWCLEQQQLQMQMLVEQLDRADAEVTPYAAAAAARLGPASQCADARRLAQVGAVPHDRRAARSIASDLARAGALEAIARPEAAAALARSAARDADELASPALHAAARFRLGMALDASGQYDEAERELEAAYFEASQGSSLDLAADAATALAQLRGYTRQDTSTGLRWAKHAALALDLVHEPTDSLRRAALEASLGATYDAAGELELATTHQAKALELKSAVLGEQHPGVASAMNNLASVLEAAGRPDEAEALHRKALGIKEATLGAKHPSVAMSLSNIGNIYWGRGELAQARDFYMRAVQVREAAHQGEHAKLAITLNNLGGVQFELGEFDAAASSYARALSIREAALGPAHPKLVFSLEGLADASLQLGKASEAISFAERALKLQEARDAPAAQLAASRFLLAQALWVAPVGDGQDHARARVLALAARDALAAKDAAASAPVDAWLVTHPHP